MPKQSLAYQPPPAYTQISCAYCQQSLEDISSPATASTQAALSLCTFCYQRVYLPAQSAEHIKHFFGSAYSEPADPDPAYSGRTMFITRPPLLQIPSSLCTISLAAFKRASKKDMHR